MENVDTSRFGTSIGEYRENGFAKIQGLFTHEEAKLWANECDRVWSVVDKDDERVNWRDHGELGSIPDRLDPVVDISPVFAKLAADQRLTEVAKSVLGQDESLFKGKLIMKLPGTMGYDLHQDYPYWEFLGIPADDLIIMVVPIDAWDESNGGIEFFPGYHHERIPGPPDEPLDTDPALVDLSSGSLMTLNPGDVCFFHPLAPHQSAPNTSKNDRRTLYFTYVKGVHKDVYEKYYTDRPEYEGHKKRSA